MRKQISENLPRNFFFPRNFLEFLKQGLLLPMVSHKRRRGDQNGILQERRRAFIFCSFWGDDKMRRIRRNPESTHPERNSPPSCIHTSSIWSPPVLNLQIHAALRNMSTRSSPFHANEHLIFCAELRKWSAPFKDIENRLTPCWPAYDNHLITPAVRSVN